MTTTRLGLMGFGRIGRNVFRLLHDRHDLEIVAISDIAAPKALTYLLKYDSIYGRFPIDVSFDGGSLNCGSQNVAWLDGKTPSDVSWADHDVDIVIDTTSRYLDSTSLGGHIDNGAARVILTSSPRVPGDIPLLLRGVNDEVLDDAPDIVALGSNTSNAAAPILKTLDESFGLEFAYMTTVKAMSNSGRLADVPTDSYRTSRAAGENIIPSDTNSADIITQALPSMGGKISVTSLNVPVPDGSNIDMVAQIASTATNDTVNEAIRAATASVYEGIIEYVDDPIVSSDVRLDPHSGIFDSLATLVTGGDLVKTITWFNNGWGYSHRAIEVASRIGAQLEGDSR